MKRMYSLSAIFVTMAIAFVSPVSGRIVSPIPEPDASVVSVQDRIQAFFDAQTIRRPEKLFLHLNQPYYGAGDTIRFKAYLTDAVFHRPDTLSNFLYVDLSDRLGTVVASRKIKRDSLGFANGLPLPDTLPAGEYTLRAYTGWMLNFDPAFFFRRNLSVGSMRSERVHSSVAYSGEQVIVRFSDAEGKPVRDASASYELFDRAGRRVGGFRQRTTSTGALFVDLPHDSIRNGGSIRMMLDEGGTVFRRTVFLEPETHDFAVGFFPEGGDLVDGVPRKVAFKAERSDGYPEDVRGSVLDSRGDTVVSFASEHDGMGAFLLCARQGETYRAVCRAGRREITVALPEIRPGACALTAAQSSGRILYKADGTVPRGSRLVGHIRGDCRCVVPVDPQRPSGAILADSLPEGILHLLLVDSTGRPRSERLVFLKRTGKRERWTVTPDKPRYGKREKVRVGISLEDSDGKPVSADLSVSVTDRRAVRYDSLGDDIRTNLLLCSDVKGYVHNPGYYFLGDDPAAAHRLDLVMLTHGWRRFRAGNLYDPEPFSPKHFVERGQYLSGKVIGIAGRAAPGALVSAVALNRDNVADAAQADDSGRFVLSGLDFADTVLFMVSAKTRRGKPTQRIDLDGLYPRPPLTDRPPFPDSAESVRKAVRDYLKQQKLQHTTIDGMKVYELEGVEVKSVNPQKQQVTSFGALYDTIKMSKYKPITLYNYVCSYMPEVHREKDLLYLKRMDWDQELKYALAQLNVNRQIVDLDYLKNYLIDDVDYIYVAKDTDWRTKHARQINAGINLPTYPYRIDIFLKPGRKYGIPDTQTCKVVGYSENIEFYHPVYDTPEKVNDEKSDKRTTVYWNPYVKTDPDGNTTIEFYTNDTDQADYDIDIEGIAPDGTIYKSRQKL